MSTRSARRFKSNASISPTATINFVRVADAKFSQAVKRYTITAPGREWLAEQGF
jgi:hypothetical protein